LIQVFLKAAARVRPRQANSVETLDLKHGVNGGAIGKLGFPTESAYRRPPKKIG